MTTPPTTPRPRWVALVLVLGPLWLIVSAAFAIWLSLRNEDQKEREAEQRFTQEMSVDRIADDLGKFTTIIGERHLGSGSTRRNLSRAASMIDGLLGPQNTGYAMRRIATSNAFPILIATLHGQDPDSPPIWLVTNYDSPPASIGGEMNASGCAALIAAAQSMANDKPNTTIHFIFMPHGQEEPTIRQHGLTSLLQALPRPRFVACIDAMGALGPLHFLSTTTTTIPELEHVGTLGLRGNNSASDNSLSDEFDALALPSIRITSLPSATPQATPSAQQVAVAAGKLVAWLRLCTTPAKP